MEDNLITTRQKALRINLDTRTYGTFAEIGAGQEVAAWFFKAGAASGTIAKTMSAYDMTFSDAIYGKEESGRYVCESRLMKMLNREYKLLEDRLINVRPPDTLFFAFANTVVAINYNKTNQGHGWLGVRWQLYPRTQPNDFIIHVNMYDNENLLQQQAIGILGVNMVYACFYYYDNVYKMIDSLFDGLSRERIEIDYLKITGNDFKHVDNRLNALYMVKSGYTDATLLSTNGDIIQPSEALYKRNILVTRGRFRPPTKVNVDMFQRSFEQFSKDPEVVANKQEVVQIAELTLKNLHTEMGIDEKDFLDRADILCKLGLKVMISNYQEYYRLVSYLSNITKNKIGIVLGIFNLMEIFNEEYYKNLKGGILESFATLFSRNVKIYVYPTKDPQTGNINRCKDFKLPYHLKDLYDYLLANNKLEDIEGANTENLSIFSDAVIKKIKDNESGWEWMVPELVENEIKKNKLFGYKGN